MSLICAGGDDSTIYAVDGTTGLKKWETPVKGRGTSSLLFRDGLVYVHVGMESTENTICALNIAAPADMAALFPV